MSHSQYKLCCCKSTVVVLREIAWTPNSKRPSIPIPWSTGMGGGSRGHGKGVPLLGVLGEIPSYFYIYILSYIYTRTYVYIYILIYISKTQASQPFFANTADATASQFPTSPAPARRRLKRRTGKKVYMVLEIRSHSHSKCAITNFLGDILIIYIIISIHFKGPLGMFVVLRSILKFLPKYKQKTAEVYHWSALPGLNLETTFFQKKGTPWWGFDIDWYTLFNMHIIILYTIYMWIF